MIWLCKISRESKSKGRHIKTEGNNRKSPGLLRNLRIWRIGGAGSADCAVGWINRQFHGPDVQGIEEQNTRVCRLWNRGRYCGDL